ncbi:hypothetical protein KBB05_05435 [Patescibacteria group bacterium]|nr:hypothetical protein [Patescibacteria group bacterium]
MTVSKKAEEETKTEIKDNNTNTQLFTGLTPPAGKKILDLKDKDTKTKLEAVFTAIGGVS